MRGSVSIQCDDRRWTGLHFDSAGVRGLLPALVLVCTSLFAYGLCGPQIGWLSDDYREVFGYSAPVPGWRAAFQIGGAGWWSPYRLLKYPIQGYLAYWLGPGYTHVVQFLCHLTCVLLFYALLRRLAWPTEASLAAAMIFSVSPWFEESVYWWPSASSIWATILVLAAAHCFLWWRGMPGQRWAAAAYASLMLLSLVCYEIWMGGFLFFAGLDWYVQRTDLAAPRAEASGRWRDFFNRYAVIGSPFLAYAMLYKLAPSADAASRVSLPIAHIPASVAMVQLRALQWPLDTQWRWTFQNAHLAFHSTVGVAVLVAEVAVLALLGTVWVRKRGRREQGSGIPLWGAVVLAWTLFMGSRIALVLQDHISRIDTRENYGASMGMAIAATAVVWRLLQTQFGARLRATVGVIVLALVLLLGWTCEGIGVHYVETSKAEAQTIRALDGWMSAAPRPKHGMTIVVVAARDAAPRGTIELAYFTELDGVWLDCLVKRHCGDCEAFVVENVECVNHKRTIILRDPVRPSSNIPEGRMVLGDDAALFRWTGRALIVDRTSCR